MTTNIARFLRHHAPTILTILGAAGTVATAVMAVKATPKAMRMLAIAQADKSENLTRTETVLVAAPAYIPSALMGVSTIICIFGANTLNQKQQASLASAYAMASRSYSEYRKKVIEMQGEDSDTDICRSIAQDREKEKGCTNGQDDEDTNSWAGEKLTWHIDGQPGFFERTKEEVFEAEYKFLRNYRLRYEEATLNDLYEMLELPPTEEGELLGWTSAYLECHCGSQWIDFEHRPHTLADGMEVIGIYMPFEPSKNYLSDPDGCW